jgi:Cdc6-like AAA superfamily ATPase
MAKLSREQIENAFLPAREITDPSRFAGRRRQLEDSYLALLTQGANIALVGNRGMGKTSLARQIVAMASGNNVLLERHRIDHDRKLDFLCTYLACGRDVQSTEHLLERLLTGHDCLAPWVYDVPAAKKTLAKYQPKFGAKILGVEIGIGGEKSTEVTTATAGPIADTYAVFANVMSALAAERPARDGILVVIDEFDQVRDRSGFASLLKSLATNVPFLRFCIVGVAHDLYDLIAEHQSADRLFAGGVIPVPDMSTDELSEIIDIAERQLGSAITFDDAARVRLVEILAQGHPYMVHLIGKHALRAAWRSQTMVVSANDIASTLRTIAESGADPVLEQRYKRAIASSPQREAVLRALAAVEKAGEIWTTDAYPVATRAGVDNPSQYVGNLVTDEYGSEIVKIRERYYRFRDSLFRTYILVRPSQYATAEESDAL